MTRERHYGLVLLASSRDEHGILEVEGPEDAEHERSTGLGVPRDVGNTVAAPAVAVTRGDNREVTRIDLEVVRGQVLEQSVDAECLVVEGRSAEGDRERPVTEALVHADRLRLARARRRVTSRRPLESCRCRRRRLGRLR